LCFCQHKAHDISIWGLRLLCTFYYGGLRWCSLCAQHHGLGLGKGSGLLNSRRRIFLSSHRARFFFLPGQIGGFRAQYKFGGQPSKITKLHVLLGDGFDLQAGLDNNHDRSAKYAGDINKLGFRGCLLFSLGCYWSSGSSSRGRLWPALFCRPLRLGSTRRLMCHLWHRLFYGGGRTAAPLSRLAHRVPVVFFPLIRGVGRWNFLRQLKIQLSARNTSRQVLDYSLEEFTSWEVVAVIFSFLATRFHATLRGLLGGAGRLASKVVGGSSMRGIWGSPGQLNLDRKFERSWSVSPSSSSDVSSMVSVSSPSLTSRRSFALPLPSSGIFTSRGGEVGSETNFAMSSYSKQLG
jgi:hypothetical protein